MTPTYLQAPYEPVALNAVEQTFPGRVTHLMPDPADFDPDRVPDHWHKFILTWFHDGLIPGTSFLPKEGIDAKTAYTHLNGILRSFEPKHERKMEALAFLCDKWLYAVISPERTALFGTIPAEMVEKD